MGRKYHPDYEDTAFSRRWGEFSAENEMNFEKHLAKLDKSFKREQETRKRQNWATLNRAYF